MVDAKGIEENLTHAVLKSQKFETEDEERDREEKSHEKGLQ